MPIKNYTLLKGKASDFALDDDNSPHIEIRIEAAGTSHRIAVNVRSKVAPHDLLYQKQTSFSHPMLPKLQKLAEVTTDIKNQNPDLALDYARGEFIKREEMEIAPFKRQGPDNDLRDYLEPVIRKGIENPDSITFYAFGEAWGPEPDKQDKYFHFKPGNGIHDIHMNQGSSGRFRHSNGINQDGALLIHFEDEDRWTAIFLAFQSQSWNTDNHGHPTKTRPAKTTHIEPLKPGVTILAALINPTGREEGNETVTLLNRTDDTVNLSGWKIADAEGRELPLDGTIEAGETRRIILINGTDLPRLRNKGGKIVLLTNDNVVADQVNYKKEEAAREGWTTIF